MNKDIIKPIVGDTVYIPGFDLFVKSTAGAYSSIEKIENGICFGWRLSHSINSFTDYFIHEELGIVWDMVGDLYTINKTL